MKLAMRTSEPPKQAKMPAVLGRVGVELNRLGLGLRRLKASR